ncbi:dTDP-glucose 4,6-dehydratase [bacterium]|nr:MAG: dTDP-glucose 4,6-dehydratase [bacterium]
MKLMEESFELIEGDICDEQLLLNLFKKYEFDGVFHFAAESHVDRSIDGPREFIDTNIIGTFNLLQASRANISKDKNNFKFIHVSTDEVYGDLGQDGYFDEESPYRPNSPYSASKAASDHLSRSWSKTFNLPVIITNCSNNYGANQFPEKLIPLMIINCIDWKQLPVYGNGENIRDWLFVEDHCIALETIFSKGEVGETYNIGGSNEIKNIDIVKIICDIMDELKPSKNGSYRDLITFVDDRPGHDKRYAVDSTKLQNTLKWKPRESFQSGIKKTIKWYLNNEDWWRKIQKNNYNQQRLGLKNK